MKKQLKSKRTKAYIISSLLTFSLGAVSVLTLGSINANSDEVVQNELNEKFIISDKDLNKKMSTATYIRNVENMSTTYDYTIKVEELTVDELLEFDINNPSLIGTTNLDKALSGTNLEGLANSFISAEYKYGINALYLASIAIVESDWGTSEIARERNNLFRYTDREEEKLNSSYFETKEDSITKVAEYLQRNYIAPDGVFHNGVKLNDIAKNFTTDKSWSVKVAKTVQKLAQYYK